MHPFRYLYLSVAATLIAMAIAIPAQAAQSEPLRRGLSDFRQEQVDFWNYDAQSGKKIANSSPGVAPQNLSEMYSQGLAKPDQPLKRGLSDFGISQARSAVPSQPSDLGNAPVSRRGLADFGLAYGYTAAATSSAQQAPPVALAPRDGFDWRDAGVGAGFAAGMAVLLGALLIVASHRRSSLKRA